METAVPSLTNKKMIEVSSAERHAQSTQKEYTMSGKEHRDEAKLPLDSVENFGKDTSRDRSCGPAHNAQATPKELSSVLSHESSNKSRGNLEAELYNALQHLDNVTRTACTYMTELSQNQDEEIDQSAHKKVRHKGEEHMERMKHMLLAHDDRGDLHRKESHHTQNRKAGLKTSRAYDIKQQESKLFGSERNIRESPSQHSVVLAEKIRTLRMRAVQASIHQTNFLEQASDKNVNISGQASDKKNKTHESKKRNRRKGIRSLYSRPHTKGRESEDTAVKAHVNYIPKQATNNIIMQEPQLTDADNYINTMSSQEKKANDNPTLVPLNFMVNSAKSGRGQDSRHDRENAPFAQREPIIDTKYSLDTNGKEQGDISIYLSLVESTDSFESIFTGIWEEFVDLCYRIEHVGHNGSYNNDYTSSNQNGDDMSTFNYSNENEYKSEHQNGDDAVTLSPSIEKSIDVMDSCAIMQGFSLRRHLPSSGPEEEVYSGSPVTGMETSTRALNQCNTSLHARGTEEFEQQKIIEVPTTTLLSPISSNDNSSHGSGKSKEVKQSISSEELKTLASIEVNRIKIDVWKEQCHPVFLNGAKPEELNNNQLKKDDETLHARKAEESKHQKTNVNQTPRPISKKDSSVWSMSDNEFVQSNGESEEVEPSHYNEGLSIIADLEVSCIKSVKNNEKTLTSSGEITAEKIEQALTSDKGTQIKEAESKSEKVLNNVLDIKGSNEKIIENLIAMEAKIAKESRTKEPEETSASGISSGYSIKRSEMNPTREEIEIKDLGKDLKNKHSSPSLRSKVKRNIRKLKGIMYNSHKVLK